MRIQIIILFLNFIFCAHSIAQITDLQFTHIENPTQTTTLYIHKIVRDSDGFMWFATDNGLYMYNGYEFTEFKYNPQDSNSLCLSRIHDIVEDDKGNLFIATIMGLSIYSHDKVGFKNYRQISFKNSDTKISKLKVLCKDLEGQIWIGTESGLIKFGDNGSKSELFFPEIDTTLHNGGTSINCITTDSNNYLWMGTWGGGLLQFNPETKIFKRFVHNPHNPASIPSNIIQNITVSKEGLWIDPKNKGLSLFDPQSGKTISNENEIYSQFSEITALLIHSSGQLMVGTRKGLSILSKDKTQFRHYVHNPLEPSSVAFGGVVSILEDKDRTLWIGTTKINKYNPMRNKFAQYYHKPKNSELQDYTKSLVEDKQHNIWIGTFGQGLKKYSPQLDTFQRITTQNPKTSLLPSDVVTSLLIDDKNQLWIGTLKGICIYDLNTNTFVKTYEHNNKLLHINIYYLFQDKRGIIWICTQEGVHTYNPKDDKLRTMEYERKGFNFKVKSIVEDKQGNVWLGTDNGLIRYNTANDKFTAYYHVQNQKDAISNNAISRLFIDNKDNLWIATGAGLNLYLPDKDGFKTYNKSDGFADEYISNILQDEQNNLWCVTSKGIIKFDPQTGEVRNYDLKDGAEFNRNGKQIRGEKFLLGGAHRGFYVFHPDSIKNNTTPPPVYITDFSIFNKPVKPGKNSVLKKTIITTKEIVLSYKQSVFSFGFAALNYIRPEKNQYAYKMKGFDDEWRFTNSENRIATYTNLAPGDYIFRVKASNNDGVWNTNGVSIKITITPPWWQTWWFRITLFLTIAGGILAFYFWRVSSLKARQRELENKVNERTAKLQEANLVLEERQEEILQQSEELQQQSDDLKQKNEEISKAYNNMQLISEFGQKISASLNLEFINKMMYNYINSLMDTDVFGIGIYNEKKQRLEYHNSIEAGEELPYSERTIHKKNSLSIWSFNNQKTVFINHLDQEYSKYISKKPVSKTSKLPKSLIHIPLTAENKKIGIITINSFRENAYSKTDLDNLLTLASYLAIALDNANAYTLVHRQNEHIQSAIHYAQTIQQSILPLQET